MITAIYPGTFDPITNGHIDIALRSARLFHRVIIGVYAFPKKEVMFSLEERVHLAREAVKSCANITVEPYGDLTVEFARKVGAQVMVRGLRVSGDFEWEFDMAMMNRRLNPELEMVCFMASPQFQFLSSSILKEVARLRGNINDLVPAHVINALAEKQKPAGTG
ncbi:MAG: pantetheine-phosphate adenylyltransferase [Dehalococcoidaceae bacterium]|nr:pantetheine-phosphate adenylyltransferase [Dehalococcoidaceae bacterium]